MRFSNDILIFHAEPEQETGSHPWLFLLIGLLLVCLLFLPPRNQGVADDYHKDPNVTSWLSKEKARELMRYHGTNGIMITEDRVYIKRDSRWICVYQDPSAFPEGKNIQEPPTAAVRGPGGRS